MVQSINSYGQQAKAFCGDPQKRTRPQVGSFGVASLAVVATICGVMLFYNLTMVPTLSLSRQQLRCAIEQAQGSELDIFPTSDNTGDHCSSYTIAWFTDELWESNYLPQQMLGNIPVNKVLKDLSPCRPDNHTIPDCSIAIMRRYLHYSSDCHRPLIQRSLVAGHRFAVVFFGDEGLPCGSAGDDIAPLVIRNFWNETCQDRENVMIIPLGVKSGRLASNSERARPPSARKNSVVFASPTALNEVRKVVSEAFSRIPDSDIIFPGEVPNFQEFLFDSKFALAPRGAHEDTLRLMEALDSGCIPIVTDGHKYFSHFMPKALTDEFITIDENLTDASISRAIAEVERLLANEGELDAKAKRLIKASLDYRDQWQHELTQRIRAIT